MLVSPETDRLPRTETLGAARPTGRSLLRFLMYLVVHRSISRALWVLDYEREEYGNGQ